jgi:3-demethoxyubiquinol 3-hydroxylase
MQRTKKMISNGRFLGRMTPKDQTSFAEEAGKSSDTMCVMFDGSCPLCRREISLYQSIKPSEPVRWVDVSLPNAVSEIDRFTLMSRFHVQKKNGQMLSGAAAFVALWAVMPGWRWLAYVVNTLKLTPLLEGLYLRFLSKRPALQRFVVALDTNHLPPAMIPDIRSDHAGETGAVYIYKGILAVTRDAQLMEFANRHLATEKEHLRQINLLLPKFKRSWLLPGWKMAGFITGAIPAMFGARAVFATIAAVESFVDRHYQQQIQALSGSVQYASLERQLLTFQADEVDHRDEALAQQGGDHGRLLKLWCFMVEAGSVFAVKIARVI